ncbi:MAG: YHS domain-containing (seleno)protein [Bacteroidota bacterium]
MKRTYSILAAALIAVLGYAQENAENFVNGAAPFYNVDKDSLALDGFDPTEYFINNRAILGSMEHQYEHKGIIYHFVSKKNKSLFKENPEKYLPEFGGYCAYGIGMLSSAGGGSPGKYPVNPKTFKIIDNKLYLFYDDKGYNFLNVWEKDELQNLKRAHQRWKTLYGVN